MYHVLKVFKNGGTYIVSPNNMAMSKEVATVLLEQFRKTETTKGVTYCLAQVVE